MKNSLPASVCSFSINLFGVALFFTVMLAGGQLFPEFGTVKLTMIALLATAVPLWLYDFFVLRVFSRSSTGLGGLRPTDKGRLVRKLIGLYGTFLIILFLYYINPVYYKSPRASEFYNYFFEFLNILAPWIVVLSLVYFHYIDRRQKDPFDGYWHMGCFLTGRFKEVNTVIIKEHARVWFIKGFFIPFMFALLVMSMDALLQFNWRAQGSFIKVFNQSLDVLYAVDLIYGALGYILTIRLLDTHIQSTDPTWAGWLSCLACYHPFYAMFGLGLFPTEDGIQWDQWLAAYPFLYWFCAALIFVSILVYALATVSFGYRMSNLTYRGIITSGLYRWTKHPAYIGKVLSWWLISLPFLTAAQPLLAAYFTFNMIVISLVYYLRARTEENHLSNYPEYVEYANWINEHGVFRFLGRMFPALRYSEEKCKRSKSVVWFKQLKQK